MKFLICNNKGIMVSEISETERQIPYGFTYMWNLKKVKQQKKSIQSKCLLLMKLNLNFHPCNTDPFICPTDCTESQRNFLDNCYMRPLWKFFFFLNA